MGDSFCYSVGVDRDHTIYRFTDQIYKVVQWYEPRGLVVRSFGSSEDHEHYDEKLESSLSRSRRVVLEKALCNHWDWFCTFTISDKKADRGDLAAWWKSFSQWLRDLRKKGMPILFLLIPERHSDGCWHMHGLLSGLDSDQLISFRLMDKQGYLSSNGKRLPLKIRKSSYLNWPAYADKFGFCSLARLQNPVAAGFYVTKYMTKDHARMVSDVGLHSYYVSQGLATPVKQCDYFGRDQFLESVLVNKHDFCATGFTHCRDGLDWTFMLDQAEFEKFSVLDFDAVAECSDPAASEAEDYFQFEQMCIDKIGGVFFA